MEVTLGRSGDLPPGTLLFPPQAGRPGTAAIRLGTLRVQAECNGGAPDGRLLLAPDLWDGLAIPFDGIRLELHRTEDDEFELGPAVAALYLRHPDESTYSRAQYRAELWYGHVKDLPGLHALGFLRGVDWDAGVMDGFVVDNRPGSAGAPVRARFPIPAALFLLPGVPGSAAERLKELTQNRTLNWVRSFDKYLFYTLLSEHEHLREHLPDTRLLQSETDLAVMLTRYGTVFVKNTRGSRGRGIARVRPTDTGFEGRHIDGGRNVTWTAPHFEELMSRLRPVLGRGWAIVQQGVRTVGLKGHAAHFRIVLTKDGQGRWHCPYTEALASADKDLVITNFANGGMESPVVDHLCAHHGLSPAEAARCEGEMVELCTAAAQVLDQSLYPLGILGFDVARDAQAGQLWLFEANTVPGLGYPDDVVQRIYQSLTDYLRYLAR